MSLLDSKHIVLVNDDDAVLGTLDKIEAHNACTPLHRGISVFLFNDENKVLLQRRALVKKTWPGFWSNSFCGHPQSDETYEQAVHRHAELELNAKLINVKYIFHYQYKAINHSVCENEICYVYTACLQNKITVNEQEIYEIRWMDFQEFVDFQQSNLDKVTPWCVTGTQGVLNSKASLIK